ncbi:MAG: hypothetical protein OXT09_08325 [Myxococcales bacterium]|nr:hypothetical protein [Myxococcales bacterium]
MPRIPPLLALLLVAGLSGCELVADFDRDKIPVDRPDGGGAMDASMEDAAAPPEEDAAAPEDAGNGSDDPIDSDAGDDDAGNEDAGQ